MAGDILARADTTKTPDWGKVEAYLPQGSFARGAEITNYDTHLFAQTGINQVLATVDFLQAKRHACIQIEAAKNFIILIEEARKTTETGLLSLVYDTFHADIKAANILTVPHHSLLIETPPDLFDGYEQYQIANWDGHGAEAITVATRTLVASCR